MVLLIFLAALCGLIGWWYTRHRKFAKYLEKIPGPPPLPIVGNTLEFANPKAIHTSSTKYLKEYGGIVKLHIGPTPTILLVSDYAFLEFILTSTEIVNKSEEYKYLSGWLGTGLLLSDGNKKWKRHRKFITPTFHFQILENFVDAFESSNTTLIRKLREQVGNPKVDIYPYITLYTLDVICETAMGTSVDAQEGDSDYVRSVQAMCRLIMDRTYKPLMQVPLLYAFSSLRRNEMKCVKILHDYTNSVIRKRKIELEQQQNHVDEDDTCGLGTKRRLAFLDLLLKNKEESGMTDEEIREEVDTFMFAGHDTTASGLSFAMYCLSEHPEVQEKVMDELREIFSHDKMRSSSFRDLSQMKYLEAVIKESLRLYTPVPIYGRSLSKDTEYNGMILPKGLSILIHAFNLHRNPTFFPEPDKFIPERFIGEDAKRPSYSYIPFSAGLRNCLGQKFAMLEMKSILSAILRNFELRPATPKHALVLESETVLKSENGICISLRHRDF